MVSHRVMGFLFGLVIDLGCDVSEDRQLQVQLQLTRYCLSRHSVVIFHTE